MVCNVTAVMTISVTALGVALWFKKPKIELRHPQAITYLVVYAVIVVFLGVMTFSGSFDPKTLRVVMQETQHGGVASEDNIFDSNGSLEPAVAVAPMLSGDEI